MLRQTQNLRNQSEIEEPEKDECKNIKVAVRCRPMGDHEVDRGERAIVRVKPGLVRVLKTTKMKNHEIQRSLSPDRHQKPEAKVFRFDFAYDQNSSQHQIYHEAAKPIIMNFMKGYNSTIFCYGQTGTGKTYTMNGDYMEDLGGKTGIMPSTFEEIFRALGDGNEDQYAVSVSYMEIYKEEIRDLISNGSDKLVLKEHPKQGVFVQGLSCKQVKGVEQIHRLVKKGALQRATASTMMNEVSSRSHALLQLKVEFVSEGKIL